MPTFTHGSNADLFASGFDITRMFRSVDAERKQDVSDVTCFNDTAKRFQVGLVDGMLSAAGIYDASAPAAPPDADSVLRTALDAVQPLISYCPEGAVIGKPVEGLAGPQTKYSIESPIADITAVTIEAVSAHGLERMVSLHDMVSMVAGTTLFAGVDNGVLTTGGLVSYLHVASVTAGNIVVKVQHSVDNVTYVDLVTHTSVIPAGAPIAERIVVAPGTTVNRWLRCSATVTTGPATFHVAAGRTPRNG